jgi:NADH:ubiquinone reductase (H+-translocating)
MTLRHGHHVVIVGGGFGGLNAALALRHSNVRVTVVDRQNHHVFQPLLYQVATAGLAPTEIAYPIRATLRRRKNACVLLAEVLSIDTETRTVHLRDGEIGYDSLILAAGATHSYFGHPGWESCAPGLKTLDDALEIRNHILLAFEMAERESDSQKRKALLTFVVVGGGPTGVELAGAIAEIACLVMTRDFRRIDPCSARTILLEAGPRVLASFPEDLSARAEESLAALGVDVRTGTKVESIRPGAVVAGAQEIRAGTVLWAAGVTASPLARSLQAPLDRAGRVLVEPDLSLRGHPEVFVIGDLAAFLHQTGQPLPGVAPVAIQQGRHAARNILRDLSGAPRHSFHYRDKGTLATIGRAAAVADFGRLRISGFFAWVAWLFIHILFLIGFRNRFAVLFDWAWAYVTFQRSARLITRVGATAAQLERMKRGDPAQ